MLLVASAVTFAPTVRAAPPDEAPGQSPAAGARARDAAIDRGFLTAHAETIGRDKWAINAYELVFIGVTYGFTDDIQASLSTLLPVTTDIPLVLALQPKFVLARTDTTVVALRVPLTFVTGTDGEGSIGTFGAGALVDHYLDPRGRIALHGGLLVSSAFGSPFDLSDAFDLAQGAIFELDLGASLGVSRVVKLLLEVQTFAALGTGGFEVAHAVLVNYGLRLHGDSLAGDLGFIRPIGVDTDPLLLGIPYLALSSRF